MLRKMRIRKEKEKGGEFMKRGLVLGLCLGLLLSVGTIAHADLDYGAYERFLSDMGPALRASAALKTLQTLILRDPSGTITSTIMGNLWTVYVGGVQSYTMEFDDKHHEWYKKTDYYVTGSIVQYAVNYKLERNEDGTYTQTGIESIDMYDAVGQLRYSITIGNGLVWEGFNSWEDLKDAWGDFAKANGWIDRMLDTITGKDIDFYSNDLSDTERKEFWQRLFDAVKGNLSQLDESDTGVMTFVISSTIGGSSYNFHFRLGLNQDGTAALQYYTDPDVSKGDDGNWAYDDSKWSTTTQTVDNFTLGADITIGDLDPGLLAQLFQAVTNGVPKTAITIGGTTAIVTLTGVILSGADIIELGEAGVMAYLDTLGVDEGVLRVSDSAGWTTYANSEIFRSAILNTYATWLAGTNFYYLDDSGNPEYFRDWDEATQEAFLESLYAQILSHIDEAASGSESNIFKIKIYGIDATTGEVDYDDELGEITFKLVNDGNGNLILKYSFKKDPSAGDFSNFGGDANPLTVKDGEYYTGGERLIVGPGRDGIYGTNDDVKVSVNEASAGNIRESQRAAMQIMLQGAVESGASAGENVLQLSVAKGAMNVDDKIVTTTVADIPEMDMEQFKDYINTGAIAGIETENWTEADWELFRDIVLQIVLVDGDATSSMWYDHANVQEEVNIWTLSTGQKICFVKEGLNTDGTVKYFGIRISRPGQTYNGQSPLWGSVDLSSSDTSKFWSPVRHITYSLVDTSTKDGTKGKSYDEDRYGSNRFYVSRYTFLSGDYYGTSVSLQDPTIYGTRTQHDGVLYDPHMWGDPEVHGYVDPNSYNENDKTMTMTVTEWRDADGTLHTGNWEITLDLSQLSPDELEAFLAAAIAAWGNGTNPNLFICWGIAPEDVIENNITLVIMGLGASPIIE